VESGFAALWVPDLPLWALVRAEPELGAEPLAVLQGERPSGGARILAATLAAQAAGITTAMTLAQARARCPGLLARLRDPLRETSAVSALASVARSFSPRVHLGDEAGWVELEVRGLGELIGPPAEVARALARATRGVGLVAHVALARTTTLARLAARAAPGPTVVPAEPAAERAFVAALPLTALAPSRELLAMLHRFGLVTVGDFLGLPAALVGERLGEEGARLYAQARGDEEAERLVPTPVPRQVVERQSLEYALDNLEPLAFVIKGLLDRALARLSLAGHSAGPIDLELDYDGAGLYATRIEVASPTRDASALLSLCRLRLCERPPAQPIVAATLRVEPRVGRSQQLDLFVPAGPSPEALALVLARLDALCGPERVGVPVPRDSYQEDDFATEKGTFYSSPSPRAVERNRTRRHAACARGESEKVECPLFSSVRRLRPPQAVEVIREGERLDRIASGSFAGRIVRVWGPFRRNEGWWREQGSGAVSGDYELWDVELAHGPRCRLAHLSEQQCWLVLGTYD
jgi:protein ImuB